MTHERSRLLVTLRALPTTRPSAATSATRAAAGDSGALAALDGAGDTGASEQPRAVVFTEADRGAEFS